MTLSVGIVCFLLTIVVTLVITAWAARKGQDRESMYAASAGISGGQNGMAIAGVCSFAARSRRMPDAGAE